MGVLFSRKQKKKNTNEYIATDQILLRADITKVQPLFNKKSKSLYFYNSWTSNIFFGQSNIDMRGNISS